MKLVIAIPTLNSEEFLPYTLRSIRREFTGPVVICDQGSTDRTLEIADAFGCIIFKQDRNFATGFESDVRNEQLDFCICDGTATHFMQIDSDEIVTTGWLRAIEQAVTLDDPDYITAPYWQLIGDARYSEFKNPIEHRRIVYKVTTNLRWTSRGDDNYHCGMEHGPKPAHLQDIYYIHMSYTQTNIKNRFRYNVRRGDWSKSEIENVRYLNRIEADVYQFLPAVQYTPDFLLEVSPDLENLIFEHAKTRNVLTLKDDFNQNKFHIKLIEPVGTQDA